MRIAVYTAPKTLHVEQVESPRQVGKGEIRVQSLYSGISHGTEMNVYRGSAPFFTKKYDSEGTRLFVKAGSQETWQYPIRSCDPGVWYLGYSLVGKILEVGPDVASFKKDDVVYVSSSHQSEHVVDASSAVKLPDGLDPICAVVLTNLVTAFNGILDAQIKLGDVVVVMGQGLLGQLAGQMAKMSGAEVIVVDMLEKRLQTSLRMGADRAINSRDCPDVAMEVRKMTDKRGADCVIDVSGSSKALNEAIRIVAPEATIVALSWYQGDITLNLADEFHHNRVRIKCSQTGHTSPEFAHLWPFERKRDYCVKLLSRLKIRELITNVYDFKDIGEAYRNIDENPASVIQSVLKY